MLEAEAGVQGGPAESAAWSRRLERRRRRRAQSCAFRGDRSALRLAALLCTSCKGTRCACGWLEPLVGKVRCRGPGRAPQTAQRALTNAIP